MIILKYLKKHINKETSIETKDDGMLVGTITNIDKHMNITVENAVIRGNRVKRVHIRGSRLRSFFL